jgi:Mce-associated membrane protein
VLTAEPPRPRGRGALITAGVLVVVATGFAVWSLVAFLGAGDDRDDAERDHTAAEKRVAALRSDDDLAFGRARGEVAEAARTAVVVMNTLDYRTIDDDLENWANVTTGALHDEIANLSDDNRQRIVDAKSVTTAEVRAAAVRELDDQSGQATVLVSVTTTVQTGDAEPADRYQRMRATLARADDGWKLDGLEQVPFQGAGS